MKNVFKTLGLDEPKPLRKDYRMHMRFNKELVDKLTEAASQLGRTRTEIIEALVIWFLKENEKSWEVKK